METRCHILSQYIIDRHYFNRHDLNMKSHLFIAIGLLIGAIFTMRGLEVLVEPGIGLRELYIIGGFVIAAVLIRTGWRDRKSL